MPKKLTSSDFSFSPQSLLVSKVSGEQVILEVSTFPNEYPTTQLDILFLTVKQYVLDLRTLLNKRHVGCPLLCQCVKFVLC